MANYNKITEKQYDAIKILLKGGASQLEAAEYMHVSSNTAWRIANTEDYAEYQQILAQKTLAYKKKMAAFHAKEVEQKQEQAKPPVVEDITKVSGMVGNYQMNRVIELLKAQNETLTLISNKLAFIVDELTK